MYRDTQQRDPVRCPRCMKPLPPLDIAACTCGTWVTAFAASEVLAPEELHKDPVTRWWRVRAPCPMCGDKMALCGVDPWFLQGCDRHGYWIDADTVEHTRLATADRRAIEAKRADTKRADAERERLEGLELAAAAQREQAEIQRARLDEMMTVKPALEPEIEPRIDISPEPPSADDRLHAALIGALGGRAALRLVERIEALEKQVAELSKK